MQGAKLRSEVSAPKCSLRERLKTQTTQSIESIWGASLSMDIRRKLNWICKRSQTLHTYSSTLNQLRLYGSNAPGIPAILSYTIPKVCTAIQATGYLAEEISYDSICLKAHVETMAVFSIQIIVAAVGIYGVYTYVSSLLHRKRTQRLAIQHRASLPVFAESKLPFNLDFLWRFLNASRNNEDIFTILADSYAKNGTTFESPGLFTGSRINTIDPVNIQAVLASLFQDFELGQQLNRRLLLKRCIFTEDGPFWEHSRAMFKPQFAREQINNLRDTEVAVQELFKALPLIGTESDNGNSVEVNILPMFYRFTMDTATQFLFGESVKTQMSAATGDSGKLTGAASSLAAEFGPELNFPDALSEAQLWITQRFRLQGLHWLIPSKQGRTANAFVRKYAAHHVQLALQAANDNQTSARPSTSSAGYSLLDALIESTRDPDELRDQILGLLLAGRDTTASLLSWTVLLLARHPDKFLILCAAVLETFGPYTADTSNITFETLKSCRYLQLTLREALRLYDPSPANVRFATRDTTLPRG